METFHSSHTTMESTYPTRSIHIDQKIFTLQCDKATNSQSVIITEQNRSSSQSLHISRQALVWLASSFNSLQKDPSNFKFFKKFTDVDARLWLGKHNKKNGYYAELTHHYHCPANKNFHSFKNRNKVGSLSSP